MEKLIKKFERYIVIGLLAMMALVVFLSTVELAVIGAVSGAVVGPS